MYDHPSWQSMHQPEMVANPDRRQMNRKNVFLLVHARAWDVGLARRVRPSRPASARSSSTPGLNLVPHYRYSVVLHVSRREIYFCAVLSAAFGVYSAAEDALGRDYRLRQGAHCRGERSSLVILADDGVSVHFVVYRLPLKKLRSQATRLGSTIGWIPSSFLGGRQVVDIISRLSRSRRSLAANPSTCLAILYSSSLAERLTGDAAQLRMLLDSTRSNTSFILICLYIFIVGGPSPFLFFSPPLLFVTAFFSPGLDP